MRLCNRKSQCLCAHIYVRRCIPPMRYRYRIQCDIAIVIHFYRKCSFIVIPRSTVKRMFFHIFPYFTTIHRFTANPCFHCKSMYLPQIVCLSLYRIFTILQSHAYNGSCPLVPHRRDIAIARPPSDQPAHPTVYITSHRPISLSLIAIV